MKRQDRGIFYGWWIVIGGGTVQWYAAVVFWRGWQAFFDPMIETFGWSRGLTAGASSLQRGQSGLISPFVGTVMGRFGPRRAMMGGILVTGLAFMLMSFMNSLWQFYLAMALLTLGMSFGTFIVLVATVGNWFVRKRGKALSLLMASSAIGGFFLPLLVWSIDHYGWRLVLFGVGAGFWVIGIPAAMLMRTRPEDYGMTPDGASPSSREIKTGGQAASYFREVNVTVREAVRLRFFWQLAVAASFGQFVNSLNLFHLAALKQFGVSPATAAWAAGSVAFGDLAGRIAAGFLGDRFDKRFLFGITFVFQFIGMMSLLAVNFEVAGFRLPLWVALTLFMVCFGLGFGASVPLRLAIVADYFGRKSYGSMVGVTSSIGAAFGALGPMLVGFLFDASGSYRLAMGIPIACLLVATPLAFMLEPRERVSARVRLRQRGLRARPQPLGKP